MTEEEIHDRVDKLFFDTKADDPDGNMSEAVVKLIVQCVAEAVAEAVCPKMTW